MLLLPILCALGFGAVEVADRLVAAPTSLSFRVANGLGPQLRLSVLSLKEPLLSRALFEPTTLRFTAGGLPVACRLVHEGLNGELQLTLPPAAWVKHSPWLAVEVGRGADGCTLEPDGSADGDSIVPVLEQTALFDPARVASSALEWDRWRAADVLLLAPEAFMAELAPWRELREGQGHRVAAMSIERLYAGRSHSTPDARAVRGLIAALRAQAPGLRYVFVVGDLPAAWGAQGASNEPAPVLPGWRPKLDYWGAGWQLDAGFYSDDTLAEAGDPKRPLAVGRLPAADGQAVRDYVAKVLRYERGGARGEWRRRAVVFTGPARYGAVADALIETTAQHVLDNVLPYDWDLRFTFGFPEHPYAVAPPDLGEKLVRDLNGGALIAGYVGHGLESTFDYIDFRGERYAIGSVADVERVHIAEGYPFFVALTCLTGAFDLPVGHGLAEALVLNPNGAIAAFAAVRTVHPYANGLLAQAISQVFFVGERPKTIGEGLLAVRGLAPTFRAPLLEVAYGFDVGSLMAEHRGLYHLLGDPTLRLQYPDHVAVEGPASGKVAPGASFSVTLKGYAADHLDVTVETQRSTIRGPVPAWRELADLPLDELRAAMAARYEKVMDKVVSREERAWDGSATALTLKAPSAPGRYAVKVYAAGSGGAASGFWRFEVAP